MGYCSFPLVPLATRFPPATRTPRRGYSDSTITSRSPRRGTPRVQEADYQDDDLDDQGDDDFDDQDDN